MIKPSPATADSVSGFQGVKGLSRHKRADKPGPFIPRSLDPLPAESQRQFRVCQNLEKQLKTHPSETRNSTPFSGSIRPRFAGSNGARFVSRKPSYSENQVGEVVRLAIEGRNASSIAKELGLSRQTINRIQKNPDEAIASIMAWN